MNQSEEVNFQMIVNSNLNQSQRNGTEITPIDSNDSIDASSSSAAAAAASGVSIGGLGKNKILRAKVKYFGKYRLNSQQNFDAEVAQKLLHKATVEERLTLKTALRLFTNGICIGERGIFASIPEEFIHLDRLIGYIAMQQDTRMLALCARYSGDERSVILLQFKETKALDTACEFIDKQRHAVIGGQALSDSDLDGMDSNNGFAADSDRSRDLIKRQWLQQQQKQQQQQQQEQHTTIVHVTDDYDEGEFDTSVVFNSSQSLNRTQQKTQSPAYVIADSGLGNNGKKSNEEIEAYILNYDEVDAKPVKQQQQQRFSSSSSSSNVVPRSGRVVHSTSSGASTAVELRQKKPSDANYRTSTVIYRDLSENPEYNSVSNSQQVRLQQQPEQLQLMKLVPVAGSRRVKQPQHHQQLRYYSMQPLSPRESSIYLANH